MKQRIQYTFTLELEEVVKIVSDYLHDQLRSDGWETIPVFRVQPVWQQEYDDAPVLIGFEAVSVEIPDA